jgi:hypothetical protein
MTFDRAVVVKLFAVFTPDFPLVVVPVDALCNECGNLAIFGH